MTYPELMAKIVKLPGWTWEWKFGDRGFRPSNGMDGIVTIANGEFDQMEALHSSTMIIFTTKQNFIPLPTVEQWIKLFIAIKEPIFINVYQGEPLYSATGFYSTGREIRETGSDLNICLSILFARVVLGYTWGGKEFVKC